MSASYIINPIVDIKANEEKTNISTPILYVSEKHVIYFDSMATRASPKIIGGGFSAYPSTRISGGFKFGSSTGGSGFETFPKINTDHVSGE